MFRSYRDMVRVPTKAQTSLQTKVFNCDLCPKGGWITEQDVDIHKRDKHTYILSEFRTTYKDRFCSVCMTLQVSNEELIRHIKTTHLYSSPNAKRIEREVFICEHCTHIFFNKDLLTLHMIYVHLCSIKKRRTTMFTCPKCFGNYKLNSLWFHFQRHEIPSVSLCDICLDNCPNRDVLHEHVKTHNGYYNCEQCGYVATKACNYETHLKKHSQRKLQSDRSFSVMTSRSNMAKVFKPQKREMSYKYQVHNAVKGLNLPNFMQICTLCREICLSKYEAKVHLVRDHYYVEKHEKTRHFCKCGEEFFNKVLLKHHVFKMKDLDHQPVDASEYAWSKLMNERPQFVDIQDENLPQTSNNPLNDDQNEDQMNEDQTIEAQMDEGQTNEDQMNEAQTSEDVEVLLYNHSDDEVINANIVKKEDISNEIKMEIEISNPINLGSNISSDGDSADTINTSKG